MSDILHENWRDYTEEEIKKIDRDKCDACYYATKPTNSCARNNDGKDVGINTCNYILVTGKRRGCRPEVCDKFISKDEMPRLKTVQPAPAPRKEDVELYFANRPWSKKGAY